MMTKESENKYLFTWKEKVAFGLGVPTIIMLAGLVITFAATVEYRRHPPRPAEIVHAEQPQQAAGLPERCLSVYGRVFNAKHSLEYIVCETPDVLSIFYKGFSETKWKEHKLK